MTLRDARRRANRIAVALCTAAAVFGFLSLLLVLAVLVWEGVSGLSPAVFMHGAGGLLDAIAGSLMMVVFAVLIGTPLGLLAGTYMAEYGRHERLTRGVRFVNDILLSAPSIVVGLFVYQILVAPFGGYSGWAGAAALAVIVVPVVVRATEDTLLRVPDQLREAAHALGMPRSLVIRRVAGRAALAGILTGVLLAVARISGETAPLLFTAFRSDVFPAAMSQPVASLPVAVFDLARASDETVPDESLRRLAWSGALLITFTALALSIAARALSTRMRT